MYSPPLIFFWRHLTIAPDKNKENRKEDKQITYNCLLKMSHQLRIYTYNKQSLDQAFFGAWFPKGFCDVAIRVLENNYEEDTSYLQRCYHDKWNFH